MLWVLADISFLYSSGEGTLQDGDGGFLSTVLDQVMARGQVKRSPWIYSLSEASLSRSNFGSRDFVKRMYGSEIGGGG
jgi:hypothetical protein